MSATEPNPATGAAEPGAGAADPEACAAELKQRFPALFGGAPKPIKLGIQADIRERAPGVFGKPALSAFLRRHTTRTGYLIALARASHRLDLDGQPAGEISAEHRQAAADELARRRALRESREAEARAQAEAQRRQRAELLRAFEGSRVSKANFCALKGVAVDALDALLEQARQEAAERARFTAPRPARAGDAGEVPRRARVAAARR